VYLSQQPSCSKPQQIALHEAEIAAIIPKALMVHVVYLARQTKLRASKEEYVYD